jgi:ribosomal protein S18 acetylase RimI-like enzyme
MTVLITPITDSDVDSFRECLDAVAREGIYLALLEAPPLEGVRAFVRQNIANRVPQVVAKEHGRVVGWCDISPSWHHTLRHCGALGMGLLPQYRGLGLGRRLLEECLAIARAAGITRVTLEARVDNQRALHLYERAGFQHEGVRRHGMRVDGRYIDTVAMALLLDDGV